MVAAEGWIIYHFRPVNTPPTTLQVENRKWKINKHQRQISPWVSEGNQRNRFHPPARDTTALPVDVADKLRYNLEKCGSPAVCLCMAGWLWPHSGRLNVNYNEMAIPQMRMRRRFNFLIMRMAQLPSLVRIATRGRTITKPLFVERMVK